MSVRMMGAVIDCGPQEQSQFCIMMMLANNADDFGFAFPSLATLAANSRCSDKTVRRQIAELEQEGWIYVARKVLNGKCNVYILNLAKMGVMVTGDAKRSPVFMRLLKSSPVTMTPIFGRENKHSGEPVEDPVEDLLESGESEEKSPVTEERVTGHPGPSHRSFETKIPVTVCPPNRHNRQEPSQDLEPTPPLPPLPGGVGKTSTVPIPEPLSPGTIVRGADPNHVITWQRFQTALKLELGQALRHPNFAEVHPGVPDWDACFAHWAFLGLRRDGRRWAFVTGITGSGEVDDFKAGLEKYSFRIRKLLRDHYRMPPGLAIEIECERTDTEAA